LLRQFAGSLVFTLAAVVAALVYGWFDTHSLTATAGLAWIVVVLAVLEISLSFDNAVVNAAVLADMDEVWQRRFLTWGMLIAVFGRHADCGVWHARDLSVGHRRAGSGARAD